MARRHTTTRDRLRKRIAALRPDCHICGRPIDYSLPHLDPGEFVIDHVVPLKRGGTDTIDNVKAAHRSCNSAKAARDFAPIVRTSGALG
jgi:5-methylcytosine-specific restriction endonuclease McrA